MGQIRKNKKRKRYNYGKNRKRMRKLRLPKINCEFVDNVWDKKKSSEKNLNLMGLVFDVNNDLKQSKPKTELELEIADIPVDVEVPVVVKQLEDDANEFRGKGFRITKNQVEFLTYMLDKYGDDYKGMTRDKKNILQLTWKQLRAKINMFKGIPEQYEPYLKSKQLVMETDNA